MNHDAGFFLQRRVVEMSDGLLDAVADADTRGGMLGGGFTVDDRTGRVGG